MMTMLHSVLSGGVGAAGRRRSLTLLAVLALIASVLIWAAPRSEAQTNQPPVAIGEITVPDSVNPDRDDNTDPDVVTSVAPDGETTVTLDGNKSFDADDDTFTHEWEVTTDSYAFLALTEVDTNGTAVAQGADGPNATFIAPSASVAARYGFTIEFQLTVTDSKGATDDITVSLSLNQPPVEDIAVSANSTLPAAKQKDTDKSGTVDFDEMHAGDGAVIDGPGENGNGDDEWDIAENSGLTLDASGSSDVDGRVVSYVWQVYYQPGDEDTLKVPNSDVNVFVPVPAEDAADDVVNTKKTLQVAIPNITAAQSPYRVFYRLVATDDKGGTSRGAIVRLLIHDQPATPKVKIIATDIATDVATDASASPPTVSIHDALTADRVNIGSLQEVKFPGLPNPKYVVAPGATVTLDAGGSTDADDSNASLTYEWSDNVRPGTNNADTTDVDESKTRAVLRVDKDAEEGTAITVTAMVSDTSGLTGEGSIDFVVAKNTAPTSTTGVDEDYGADTNPNAGDVLHPVLLGTIGAGVEVKVIQTSDGQLGGDDNAAGDPTGTFTLRGIGFDPDQDASTLIHSWNELDFTNPASPKPYDDPDDRVLELNGALSPTVSFEVPEVDASRTVVLSLAVLDKWGVAGSSMVAIIITPANSAPSADAGSDKIVTPQSFVRLNGAGSSDPDKGDTISTWSWSLTGLSTSPATTQVSKSVAEQVRKDLAKFLPKPVDSNNSGGIDADDDGSTAYPPDVLTGATDRYPYFTAPKVADGISNIQLIFTLTVKDDEQAATAANSDTDTVTITVSNQFYSGNITGPGFCTGLSLGGPQTFAFDSDGDGVADTCSLSSTRREAVATQRALETLVALGSTIDVTGKDAGDPGADPVVAPGDVTSPASFTDLVLGRTGVTAVPAELGDDPVTSAEEDADNVLTPAVAHVSAIAGTCGRAPKDLGDSEAALAADACSTGRVAGPPPPVDPAKADVFFSGSIDGPDFCTNRSLGGARTYALDTDDDGVADICSLSTTKREAVARQNALEMFKNHPQFNDAVAAACAALGSTTFEGDSQAAMDKDACAPKSSGFTPGQALPTPSS